MNLKKKIAAVAALALVASLFFSCDLMPEKNVSIGLRAGIAGSRAVIPGDPVTAIASYRVIFKKVEIGNSEADKHTLWESDSGEGKDLVSAASFSGVAPVPAGSYKFIRLTVDPALNVDGSIDDNGTIYVGSGSVTLDETSYVWGSVLEGASALSREILIKEGSVLSFVFGVDGTVTYSGGPASGATLGLAKPSLSVTVE
jgi:hypothetical protein